MIERVVYNQITYAIIIRRSFSNPGIHFVTPNDFSQQLAFMRHPEGKIIQPHIHCSYSRSIHNTQEVLLIRKGKLKVDFYDNDKNLIDSRELLTGDVILLAEGGHGFTVIEEVEMIEVKQGPYAGELDKVRFFPK